MSEEKNLGVYLVCEYLYIYAVSADEAKEHGCAMELSCVPEDEVTVRAADHHDYYEDWEERGFEGKCWPMLEEAKSQAENSKPPFVVAYAVDYL